MLVDPGPFGMVAGILFLFPSAAPHSYSIGCIVLLYWWMGSSAASNPVGVISLNWPASSKIFDQMIPKLAQMLVIAIVLNGHLFYLYRFNNTLTRLC